MGFSGLSDVNQLGLIMIAMIFWLGYFWVLFDTGYGAVLPRAVRRQIIVAGLCLYLFVAGVLVVI